MTVPYTKIIINNLTLDMYIGVNDFEKGRKQRIKVGVEVTVTNNPDWVDDAIENVLNYDVIVQEIQRIAEQGHLNLLETYAEKIAAFCLLQNEAIDVAVKVEKPDIYPVCDSVAIHVFRQK